VRTAGPRGGHAIVGDGSSLGGIEREWLEVLASGTARCEAGARHADAVGCKAVGSHFELIDRLCRRLKMRLSKTRIGRRAECPVVSEAGATGQWPRERTRIMNVETECEEYYVEFVDFDDADW
jgi:hypothetical protein